jgi:hypothetical protein
MSSLWSAFSSPYLDRFGTLLTITQLANLNIRKSGRSLPTTVMSSGPGTVSAGEQRPLTLTSWNIDDSCGIRAFFHTISFRSSIQTLNKRCPPHHSDLRSSRTTSLTMDKSILSLFLQVSVEDRRQPHSAGTFKHVSNSCICTSSTHW